MLYMEMPLFFSEGKIMGTEAAEKLQNRYCPSVKSATALSQPECSLFCPSKQNVL